MPTKDPRSYVKTSPLPIPSQKGLKLQARGFQVYNPTSPTREQVWKRNFDRRRDQMQEQGFYSYNYKPYKGVGDPFYLDEKKMILHSLGQWDEDEDWDSTSSSEEEDDGAGLLTTAPKASMTAAKFVLRRTRKDLNTLPKEVVKGRGMIRNVRLGHGLFDLIRQERMAKKAEAVAHRKKHLEAARNQWQPPRNSSSEDESDEELDRDEDLENYFGGGGGTSGKDATTSEEEDMGSYQYAGSTRYSLDTPSRVSSGTRSGSVARKKKKQASPRPFTPQHTNLADVSEENENLSKPSLFRQLCALNWILDSMNIEQGFTMGPITTCWSHLEIGGSKMTLKRVREERRAEADFERWMSNTQMGRVSKKGSITRLNRPQRSTTRLMTHPRFSLPSTSISPSSSSSQVNASVPVTLKESTPEDQTVTSPTDPDEDETLHRTGIFKFLDEYYDSLRREAQVEEERQNALTGGAGGVTGAAATRDDSPAPPSEQHNEEQKRERRRERKAKKSKKSQDIPDRFDSPEERNRSKFFLKDLRMSENIRPKSSAELMEFHVTKPSNKYINLRQDLHNRFKEVQDDKAMTLHDVLEQMDRERLTKCQNKFSNLRMHTMSYHRAVELMRKEGDRQSSRPEDVRRQSSFKGNWYTDLLHNLSPEIKEVWYYRTVLQKLAKYGLVENTSKQSVYKFLKVLESLRHWEICSPDISAAVEFCRDKIVDMSVDEFEEWFSQAFPKVVRPRTAPPRGSGSQAATAGQEGQGQENNNNYKSQGQGRSIMISSATSGDEGVGVKGGGSGGGGSGGVDRAKSSMSARSGAKSAVSIANGAEGKRRLVQSAVQRKHR